MKFLTKSAALFLFSGAIFSAAALSFSSVSISQRGAKALVSTLSDSQLLGQVVVLRWRGAADADWSESAISRDGVGSFVLASSNDFKTAEALVAQLASLQRASVASGANIPLFLFAGSSLQQAARVGVTPLPKLQTLVISARALGKSEVQELGYRSSVEVSSLGFTSGSPLLGEPLSHSAFDSSGQPVLKAFLRGASRTQLASTLHLFSGSSSPVDLANQLHFLQSNAKAVRFLELGYALVTTGKGKIGPAALSPEFINQTIRKEAGYRGLVVARNVLGWEAKKYVTEPFGALRALEAGSDMIVLGGTKTRQRRAISLLLGRLKTDHQFRQKVMLAAQRVMLAKLQMFRKQQPDFQDRISSLDANEEVNKQAVTIDDKQKSTSEMQVLVSQQLRAAVTVEQLRSSLSLYKKTVALSTSAPFLKEAVRFIPAVSTLELPSEDIPSDSALARKVRALFAQNEQVILYTEDAGLPSWLVALMKKNGKRTALVVSQKFAAYAPLSNSLEAVIVTNSDAEAAQQQSLAFLMKSQFSTAEVKG